MGDATNGQEESSRGPSVTWVKWISVAVIVISLLVTMRALPLDRLSDVLQSVVNKLGIWGPVLFGAVYSVAVVFLIPASILTLAAGAVFGLLQGTLVVSLAANLGAAMAFLVGRYFAREKVRRRVEQSPKLSAIDRAIGEQGWKIVALLRLSPAVPFTLQNYLYGVTAIRFWPCVLTSVIAMLPGTFMYVYLGSLGARAVAGGETTTAEWIARVVGLLATIAVTVYITRLAKRAMNEKVDLEQAQDEDEDLKPVDRSEHSTRSVFAWIFAAVLIVALAVGIHVKKDAIRTFIESRLPLDD